MPEARKDIGGAAGIWTRPTVDISLAKPSFLFKLQALGFFLKPVSQWFSAFAGFCLLLVYSLIFIVCKESGFLESLPHRINYWFHSQPKYVEGGTEEMVDHFHVD